LENEEIFLLNWIKHNPFDNNPKVKRCVEKELQQVHNPDMIPDDSPLIPLQGAYKGFTKRRRKRTRRKKKKK